MLRIESDTHPAGHPAAPLENGGEIVEQLPVERLRAGETENPYTRQLLVSSRGYDRRVVP